MISKVDFEGATKSNKTENFEIKGRFLVGTALMFTRCEKEFMESEIGANPVKKEVSDYLNLAHQKDSDDVLKEKMWVHTEACMVAEDVANIYNNVDGLVRVEYDNSEGFLFRGSVEELLSIL